MSIQTTQNCVIPSKTVTTDSVCASIAYAYLERHLYNQKYQLIMPSKLNDVTNYIIKKFNIKQPPVVCDTFIKVSNLPNHELVFVNLNDSLIRAQQIYQLYQPQLMPCVDDQMRCVGAISSTDLTNALITPLNTNELNLVQTNIARVICVLNGRCQVTHNPKDELQQYLIVVVSSTLRTFQEIYKNYTREQYSQTIFVSSNHNDANDYIVAQRPGMLIICNCGETDTFDQHTAVATPIENLNGDLTVNTAKGIFEASVLIKQSTPISCYMNKQIQHLKVSETDCIDKIVGKFSDEKIDGLIVVNEKDVLINFITKHCLHQLTLNVNLIGTSDLDTLPGLQSLGVKVKSIITHDYVDGFSYKEPLRYICRNYVSTSTIVAELFEEYNIVPPANIAAVLLSGILVASSLFHQRKTTIADANYARMLSIVSGLDSKQLGVELANQICLPRTFDDFCCEQKKFEFTLGIVNYQIFELGSIELNEYDLSILNFYLQKQQEEGSFCSCCILVDIQTKQSLIIIEAEQEIALQFYDQNRDRLNTWHDYKNIFIANEMISEDDLLPMLQSTVQRK
uniref:Inorganic diphosphatase n=1 Tax=Trepomonas sp. PC1 TaxID=1076344 RepID=A0A146KIW1_9EUKA|eukprot:JAP95356.1 Inorganic diphosphatase [Trepomonas sp. PC1]